MADKLVSKIPDGPLAEKWTKRKSEIHLVSPNNKRKLEIIVVGTGLGGASAAASLGELGYNVKVFCISDSLMSVSLHCWSPWTGIQVGWICAKQGLAKKAPFL